MIFNNTLLTMANNTTAATKYRCPLVELIHQPSNSNALIGLKLLVGFDTIPVLFTIVANSILLLALAKTKLLHTPSNMLLASLCFSDLLVGVLSQPLYMAFMLKILLLETPCKTHISVLQWSGIILNGMSFIIVLYITIDRYVAVCHPFVYERKAGIKRYCIIMALTCVYKVLSPIATGRAYKIYYGAVSIVSFAVMFFCYIKIYSVIAKKERDVLKLGRIGAEERKILHRNREEKSKAYTIIVLLAVFTLSYLPPLGATMAIYMTSHTLKICNLSPNTAVLFLWSVFFLNISSVINPIVYCVYIRSIREAAAKLLFKRKNKVFAE